MTITLDRPCAHRHQPHDENRLRCPAPMALSVNASRRENVAAVRALYNQCESYDDLLSLAARTRDLLAAQLANRIRNWRANHHLDSLEHAFAEHKAYTSIDTHKHRFKRARKHPPDVPPASSPSSSPSAPQPPTVASSAPDVVPQPIAVAPAPAPSPAAASFSSSDAVLAELQAQIDALKKEVSALRGLQQQTSTPSPLQYKLITAKFRKHCRVLSIVGDGRCLLYSLLQVGHAMLPAWWEADELRQLLRTHLTTTYSDQTWSERVPPQLGENLAVSTFAERFLSQPTVHLPPDTICLWQDIVAPTTNVYVLMRSQHGAYDRDRVERLRSPYTAAAAVVLLFTWENGLGHYELVTYQNVITLPPNHAFVQHLDALHEDYVADMAVELRRQLRRESGRKRSAKDRDEVIVVEGAS